MRTRSIATKESRDEFILLHVLTCDLIVVWFTIIIGVAKGKPGRAQPFQIPVVLCCLDCKTSRYSNRTVNSIKAVNRSGCALPTYPV